MRGRDWEETEGGKSGVKGWRAKEGSRRPAVISSCLELHPCPRLESSELKRVGISQ